MFEKVCKMLVLLGYHIVMMVDAVFWCLVYIIMMLMWMLLQGISSVVLCSWEVHEPEAIDKAESQLLTLSVLHRKTLSKLHSLERVFLATWTTSVTYVRVDCDHIVF